jgi:HrpA-like RNA helicase
METLVSSPKQSVSLKIDSHLSAISDLILSNQVTLVSCPTAFGKTLGIPSYMYQDGYRVAITQPRIMLANSTSDLAWQLFGIDSQVITSRQRNKRQDSEYLVFSEGSFLNHHKNFSIDILFIDELHEQNINTEVLLHILGDFISKGVRVVLMSATMDLTKYIEYLAKFKTGVYETPTEKREFSITKKEVPNIISTLSKTDGRILFGQIGKDEMSYTKFMLEQQKYSNPIFELHSEIDEDVEKYILDYEGECVILATSVAMSGMNFKPLDIVIPPMECKKPNEKGVLSKVPLSIAELTQWEGRTGRQGEGEVWYQDLDTLQYLEKNPTPEILSSPIMDTYLQLLSRGFELDKIQLLNQPKETVVQNAKKVLLDNGLIEIVDNITILTAKGVEVSRFDSIEEGLLMIAAKEAGIENTMSKICVLIKKDVPFKKQYTFKNKIKRECEISKLSEHFMFLKCIETDENLYLDKDALKIYCENNGVIRRRLKEILRSFAWIDKNVEDINICTLERLKEVFSKGLNTNIFINCTNNENVG